MKQRIIAKLTNISKKYIIRHVKPTLVESIFSNKKKESLWALRKINLEIKKGEKIAIIGRNGSGKTTLLKILIGITTPTEGKVELSGRVAALIDFRSGFHPDLSGEENIYLNGMLLGMSKTEIKNGFDQIVNFSGLKKFIDAPFYTYSRGMALRLGFSIAIQSNPDILLIDEVFSVGDQKFQEKSSKAIKKLFKKDKTVIFISHDLKKAAELCSLGIWLEKGGIKKVGQVDQIIKEYLQSQSSKEDRLGG